MTPEQKALAKQYIENQADVSTSTSLLRAAMEEIEERERRLKSETTAMTDKEVLHAHLVKTIDLWIESPAHELVEDQLEEHIDKLAERLGLTPFELDSLIDSREPYTNALDVTQAWRNLEDR